jgi:hypothetical protein
MKNTSSALSFLETLPDGWNGCEACLRQAGPLDFLADQEHRLPKEKPKLLDSGNNENK